MKLLNMDLAMAIVQLTVALNCQRTLVQKTLDMDLAQMIIQFTVALN